MAGGAFNSASAGTVNGLSHVIPSTSRAIERCWLTLRRAHRGATATGPLNKPGVEPSGHPGNGSKTGRARVRRVSVSIERESTREFWPTLSGFRPERRRGRPEDRVRGAARERRRVCCKSLWVSGICGAGSKTARRDGRPLRECPLFAGLKSNGSAIRARTRDQAVNSRLLLH